MTASVRVAPDLPLTTLVSKPERGEGGIAGYRGNWGAAFVERIVRWLEPRRVLDPAVGGGTTVAVCQRLGAQVEGYDLRQFGQRVSQAQWWHEKVRQVLRGPRFGRLERGVYGLA
jgi:hypothetical protein